MAVAVNKLDGVQLSTN